MALANVPFTHLHLHTQYSLLDGAIKHNPLFERVKALGQEAIAMTDHGNLFGAVEFYEKAARTTSSRSSAARPTSPRASRFDKERRERDRVGLRRHQPPAPARDERDRLSEPDVC